MTNVTALHEQCSREAAQALPGLALRLLEQWSPPGGEAEVARLIADELRSSGAPEVIVDEEFPGSPSVICRLRGDQPGKTIQWHGHIDTIATPHTPPTISDGVLRGRGACDMKGAIAAMLVAVRALIRSGFPRSGEILLTFHGLHEEGGSKPLLRLLERGYVGDAALIGELGSGDQLIVGSGGLCFWDIDLKSERPPVHETNRTASDPHLPEAGFQLYSELVAYNNRVAQRGGSLFVGSVEIGDYYNRVAVKAHMSGTRRHGVNEDLATVERELAELIRGIAMPASVSATIVVEPIFEAYEIDPNTAIAVALRETVHELTGLELHERRTQSAGNAAHFVHHAGIPAVYYGTNYASAHSNDEQASLAELSQLVPVYALTSVRYLEGI